MLDNEAGGATGTSLMDPATISSTTASASGYWADLTQYRGYCLFTVIYGKLTSSAGARVQLESSASSTGSNPSAGTTAQQTASQFAAMTVAASPAVQTLLLPASFFPLQYVGANVVVTGSGNVPVAICVHGAP